MRLCPTEVMIDFDNHIPSEVKKQAKNVVGTKRGPRRLAGAKLTTTSLDISATTLAQGVRYPQT